MSAYITTSTLNRITKWKGPGDDTYDAAARHANTRGACATGVTASDLSRPHALCCFDPMTNDVVER